MEAIASRAATAEEEINSLEEALSSTTTRVEEAQNALAESSAKREELATLLSEATGKTDELEATVAQQVRSVARSVGEGGESTVGKITICVPEHDRDQLVQ